MTLTRSYRGLNLRSSITRENQTARVMVRLVIWNGRPYSMECFSYAQKKHKSNVIKCKCGEVMCVYQPMNTHSIDNQGLICTSTAYTCEEGVLMSRQWNRSKHARHLGADDIMFLLKRCQLTRTNKILSWRKLYLPSARNNAIMLLTKRHQKLIINNTTMFFSYNDIDKCHEPTQ
jgi:hypothetical protein